MATEPTLIRRYTPPTCSLEIVAQQSPLSRWMGKVALKDLRFKLSFDDPRISDDDWVVLRGDRTQLEALNQAVDDYVQSFLTQSGPLATMEQDIAAQTAIAATEMAPAAVNTTGIFLQPKGLLSHTLSLGSLATENSGERPTLTSTQLADLSTALDEYSAEATTLPQLDRQVAWLPNTAQWGARNWTRLAAGVLVTVGVGASVMNGLSNRSPAPTTASQASSSDQRLAMQPPPVTTPNPFLTVPPLSKLPTGSPLPSPGATASPTQIATATPGTANNQKIGTVDAPTIANTQGGQQQLKIVPPPQPGAAARSEAADAPASAPVPPIVDNIGGDPAPEPKVNAANDSFKGAVAQEGAARDLALGRAAPIAPPAPITQAPARSTGESQAAAVQQYFEQRWKPQAGLTKGVEYQLELDGNGVLQGAQPLGSTAEAVLPQTGIPAVGTPLAPAAKDGKATTVRLLLEPSGGVQAFPQ